MKREKRMTLSGIGLALILGATPVEAGSVKIISTAESGLFVRVVPGAADVNTTYCKTCFSPASGNPGCRSKVLRILAENIGASTFTLVGTEGGLLFNGTCSNLSTSKDYEVVFFDTCKGIGCKYREI